MLTRLASPILKLALLIAIVALVALPAVAQAKPAAEKLPDEFRWYEGQVQPAPDKPTCDHNATHTLINDKGIDVVYLVSGVVDLKPYVGERVRVVGYIVAPGSEGCPPTLSVERVLPPERP